MIGTVKKTQPATAIIADKIETIQGENPTFINNVVKRKDMGLTNTFTHKELFLFLLLGSDFATSEIVYILLTTNAPHIAKILIVYF
jgi:hypothetical protein